MDFSCLFIAHGCVLLEKHTGKTYVYKAANLQTHKVVHICHRKNKLLETEFEKFSEKIFSCGIVDLNSTETKGQNAPEKQLNELQNFIFEKLLPEHGYNACENQAELAGHMLDALNRRLISLSETEADTGIPHAYIIASALSKRSNINDFWNRSRYPLGVGFTVDTDMPVIISTSSVALQKAIATDNMPEISHILMEHGILKKPLSCVIRKGREQYICDRRLREYVNGDNDPAMKKLLIPLLDKNHLDIDLDESDRLPPFVKQRINVRGNCNKRCSAYGKCRYMRFMKHVESGWHDFQICTHKYLLADIIKRSKEQRPLMPNYQAVIIDEAHKFLQAAHRMYGIEFSSNELPRLAECINTFTFEQSQKCTDLQNDADKLAAQSYELFRLLSENIPLNSEYGSDAGRFETVVGGDAVRLIKTIRRTIEKLSAALNGTKVLKKYQNLRTFVLRSLSKAQEQLVSFENAEDKIYRLETTKVIRGGINETLLCSTPATLNQSLCRDLWDRRIPVVLTSGSLSVGGSFERVKNNMGLNKVSGYRITEYR